MQNHTRHKIKPKKAYRRKTKTVIEVSPQILRWRAMNEKRAEAEAKAREAELTVHDKLKDLFT